MADQNRKLTPEEEAKVARVKEVLATELDDADLEDVGGGYTDINFGCGRAALQ